MSDYRFSPPAHGFSKDDHEKHLLAFVAPRRESGVETPFGPSDVAHVDIVVCLDCPKVYKDELIFGDALVPRLCNVPNAEIVLGTLDKGNAKPGFSPPWLLNDPLPEEEARAQKFFVAHATRRKDGTIDVELDDTDADDDSF
jgi:hypothetical protein